MRRRSTYLWLPTVAILLVARPVIAEDGRPEITAAQVRAAIDKGVAYLKSVQKQNGSWDEMPNYEGGVSALCTLALLNAGVPVEDPQMRRALDHIRSLPPEKTYVVSLQTMVLCLAEPRKDLLLIRTNVKWLENLQINDGVRKGAWPYSQELQLHGGDPSNSQFALLALYEAERVGVSVTARTWNLALEYWLRQQNPEGSWSYFSPRDAPGTGSMTCAGISSVFIASGRTSAGDAEVTAQGLKCCGQQEDNEAVKAIEKGLTWLGNNFSVQMNPGPGSLGTWHLYYLYAVERVGRMTSHRFFNSRDFKRYDWYRMGAEALLAQQDGLNGYWKGEGHAEGQYPQISTSFAILFLAKGRRPVLISKARYGQGNDWDRHRADLAHLTTYVESKWKRDFPLGLSWQIVDLADASVDDLLQTPVLHISGSQMPSLQNQAHKLREYVDRGGFIFAEACCPNSVGFDKGFRELMEQVFDEPEYRLKPLPPEHPLWMAEEPVRPALRPNLWSIEYGCRTSVVYAAPPEQGDLPNGLSCYWEVAFGRDRKLTVPLQEQVDAALSMGINVLAYATNRELKSKDENFQLPDQPGKEQDNFERGKRYIANVRHAGGSDAAPGALPNLMRAASRELKARFGTEQRQVRLVDPDLFNYDVLYMHGRNNFQLSAEERTQLRKYLERGGTLLADAICANRDFAAAFRREINELFADQGLKLEPIPANHPMFGHEFGGFDISQVSRRVLQSRAGNGPLRTPAKKVAPEMEGLKIGDRYAVIFSPYDLSCALEKQASLECEGYTHEDAERICLNLLLYVTFQF